MRTQIEGKLTARGAETFTSDHVEILCEQLWLILCSRGIHSEVFGKASLSLTLDDYSEKGYRQNHPSRQSASKIVLVKLGRNYFDFPMFLWRQKTPGFFRWIFNSNQVASSFNTLIFFLSRKFLS